MGVLPPTVTAEQETSHYSIGCRLPGSNGRAPAQCGSLSSEAERWHSSGSLLQHLPVVRLSSSRHRAPGSRRLVTLTAAVGAAQLEGEAGGGARRRRRQNGEQQQAERGESAGERRSEAVHMEQSLQQQRRVGREGRHNSNTTHTHSHTQLTATPLSAAAGWSGDTSRSECVFLAARWRAVLAAVSHLANDYYC